MEKETLTNESLRKQFGSQFEMVSYAIAQAQDKIFEGRNHVVAGVPKSVVMEVLEEIHERGEVAAEEPVEEEEEVVVATPKKRAKKRA